jgi:hypothetical protein
VPRWRGPGLKYLVEGIERLRGAMIEIGNRRVVDEWARPFGMIESKPKKESARKWPKCNCQPIFSRFKLKSTIRTADLGAMNRMPFSRGLKMDSRATLLFALAQDVRKQLQLLRV